MTHLKTSFWCMLALVLAMPAVAQDYGVGERIIVPQVQPGAIVIDGEIEADVWDTGVSIDLLNVPSWWAADDFPQDIEDASAQVLFSNDTIYIHVFVDDNELYVNNDEPWQSDQIFVGFDPLHEAGETDQLVDQDDWAGWPDNAPGDGPHAYKIYPDGSGGAFTLNFESEPEFVDGVVYTDEDNQDWGFEAAFYVPGVEAGAEIGFNIGGAQASATACESDATFGECAYGFFSQWSTENPGGDVYSRTDSYGTLHMGPIDVEGYGSGHVVQVPRVDAGQIVIDGVADEAAWDDAQTEVNAVENWNYYGDIDEELGENPDLATETRLLWSDDTLYVYHLVLDSEIFWGGDSGSFWNSDMILLGLDNSHEGDSLFGPGFDGGAENAPEGAHTYFINEPAGFTFAWMEDWVPSDSGWVNGVVFVDEGALEWGIEAAFYVPNAEMGAEIGFDIGGAQASQDQCDATAGAGDYCDYAYYAWQTGAGGADPGAINRDASTWATLQLVSSVSADGDKSLPEGFELKQNYPNPFNPSTSITYAVPRSANVSLAVYNALGQRVATLVDAEHVAGSHTVEFQADAFPSGVYVYRMQVDGNPVASRTMLLLK